MQDVVKMPTKAYINRHNRYNILEEEYKQCFNKSNHILPNTNLMPGC